MNQPPLQRIPGTPGRPPRLAVLLSGSGSTLQNLIDRIQSGELAAEIAVVVSSRPDAFGLTRARQAGLRHETVARKSFPTVDAFNDALHAVLDRVGVDLVVLAGFLSPFQLRGRYQFRVLNVHPALIPAFSGKGFYGLHVHRAVLAAGVKVSGCTVHFADDEYDHGPIIFQECVPVLDHDTPESLAMRIQAVERRLYPAAIRLWAEGRLAVRGPRVVILPQHATEV
ncbi:MAG: phosphoribosylglycinamide formyltransferase [Candidatus Binatia bacterium]|nr:MAG: phosphoribosylglycinamide formyltransferase [Candidatus Binatia bacterium]